MRVLGEERDDKNTEPCWRYGCNKTNLSVVGEREGGNIECQFGSRMSFESLVAFTLDPYFNELET